MSNRIVLPGVVVTEDSHNSKTGHCSTTHTSGESCPPDCPYIEKGCYKEYGRLRMGATNETKDSGLTPIQIARNEARGIDCLTGMRPLRLHVGGECRTNGSAKIVSRASARYRKRFDQPVWTYTHSWLKVARSSWGNVSVLASCETADQVREAKDRGYATALVVESFRNCTFPKEMIPCPEQTKGIQCVNCRLCFKDRKDLTVVFEAHGQGKKHIISALDRVKEAR